MFSAKHTRTFTRPFVYSNIHKKYKHYFYSIHDSFVQPLHYMLQTENCILAPAKIFNLSQICMRVTLTENMTAFSCLGKRQISAPEEVCETRKSNSA